jgi:hypothetical protein
MKSGGEKASLIIIKEEKAAAVRYLLIQFPL